MSLRNISAAELRQVSKVCERVHHTCSKEPFTNHLYVVLKEFLPSIHFTIDHFTLAPLIHQEALNESLPEITFEMFRNFMHQHPGLITHLSANQNIGTLLTELGPAHYLNTELYNEVYRQVDINDQIWFGAGDQDDLIGISYSRDTAYTEKDILLLSLIQPQVSIAWKNWKRICALENQLQILKTASNKSEQQSQAASAMQASILSLSCRQREVAELVAVGKSNIEIGKDLGISPRTVGKHLEQIFTAVNVHTRTALALRFREHTMSRTEIDS